MTVISLDKATRTTLLGKVSSFTEPPSLISEIRYIKGSKEIDKLLDGKSIKEFNAALHLRVYPRGVELRVAKSLKYFSFGIKNEDLKSIKIFAGELLPKVIIFSRQEKIEFEIQNNKVQEVKEFAKKHFPDISKLVLNNSETFNENNEDNNLIVKPRNYRSKKKFTEEQLNTKYRELRGKIFNAIDEGMPLESVVQDNSVPEIGLIMMFLPDYIKKHINDELLIKLVRKESFDSKFIDKLARSYTYNYDSINEAISDLDMEKNIVDVWPDMLQVNEDALINSSTYPNGLLLISSRYIFWFPNNEDTEGRTRAETFWEIFDQVDDKLPYIPVYNEIMLVLSLLGLVSKAVSKDDKDDNALIDQEVIDYFIESPGKVVIPIQEIKEIQHPVGRKLWRKENNLLIKTDNLEIKFSPYKFGKDKRSSINRFNFHEPITQILTQLILLNGGLVSPVEDGILKRVY